MHINKHNKILCSDHKFRNRLVIKKSKISQLKKRIFSWPLLFFGSVIILIILGISPVEMVVKFLRAHESRTETVNLYARVIQASNDKNIYNRGWWQIDNAKLNPSLDDNASSLEFNDSNSAIYNGGSYSLMFSAFRFLEENEIIINNEVESALDSDTSQDGATSTLELDILGKEDDDVVDSEVGNEIEDVINDSQIILEDVEDLASGTDEVLEEEPVVGNKNDSSSFIEINEITEDNVFVEDIATEEVEEEAGIEIINDDFSDTINENVIIDDQNDENDMQLEVIDDLSWSGFYNFFTSTEAMAEEFISTHIENLEDLGEFKSAKIKLSLAMNSFGDKSNEKQNKSNSQLDDIYDDDLLVSSSSESVEGVDGIEDIEDTKNIESTTSEYIKNTINSGLISDVTTAENNEDQIDEKNITDKTIIDGDDSQKVDIVEIENEDDQSQQIIINEIYEKENKTENKTEDEGENSEEEKNINSENKEDASGLFSFIKQARADEDYLADTKLIIWYTFDNIQASTTASSTDTRLWKELDTLSSNNLSNAINGGYLSYEADFLNSWEDIGNLKIKIEAIANEKTEFIAFIDSLWIEAEYDQETELEKLEKRQRFEDALHLISKQTVFEVGEDGTFLFSYQKNENRLWDTLGEMVGIGDFWKDVLFEVHLYDNDNKQVDIPLNLMFNSDGEIKINLENNGQKLYPGKYTLKFHIEDNSGDVKEVFDIKQDFYFGVLVMNTDKDIYRAGDKAYTQMAVLDEGGHTICGADLELQVIDPAQHKRFYRTQSSNDLFINTSSACGPETITSQPDYFVDIALPENGEYIFILTSHMASGDKTIQRKVKVEPSDFIITRQTATRIYPKADYQMQINLQAQIDFFGDIKETLPVGFKIKSQNIKLLSQDGRDGLGGSYMFSESLNSQGERELVWHDIEMLAGDKLSINYDYDAPDISPEIYLVKPLVLSVEGKKIYTEAKDWQIASDAVSKRARTVMFYAGQYNGGDTSGESTNTDYTFASFNWKLAESGVNIRNAFVIFESQFEAYNSTGGDYIGYKLGFDACEESCTASAFGTGNGQVLDNNSNTLAYDETESNQIRLLLDVTDESSIAGYTGGGATMESQIGYRIKNGATKDSIANARAILVITYEYNKDTENLTNTVVYPLDSNASGDSGSRRSSQGSCTRDNDCPTFNYNMNIPEFPGVATSSNRLSQWFKVYDHNDSNNSNDMNPNVNIQTYNVDSLTMHHECANSGTQGNMPAGIYPNWASSGYSENTSQDLEYYLNSGNNYLIGGEVTETYISSSSASIKTKTVSFPMGIIDNGGDTSLHSKAVAVYFPENGDATGTVSIQKAWLRIKTHNQNSANLNTQVSTKVGSNATSSTFTYAYNGGGAVIKPLIDIIHIIPSSEYAELAEANLENARNVQLNITQSATTYGGVSAELLITYTYTSEAKGYLTNLILFGGQSSESPLIATTTPTATLVMPENSNKTVYAGGLWASFLNSDSGGSVGAGTVFQLDASLSTSSPTCSVQYNAEPDDMNSYTEFYKDVSSFLGTTDKEQYYACYADDESLTATDGAKMNGMLIYTYGWENSAPTSTLDSAIQKVDGSQTVDISIGINDINGQEVRAKLRYATGTSCSFVTASDPFLDESDVAISASFGDPAIENDNIYQIGTPVAYILTASGTNTVNFDWVLSNDLPNIEGYYCLELTANDQYLDQITPATSTVYIDTLAPTNPGVLSLYSRTGTSLVLNLGATTTETNFKEYKIFYKVYDGSDPGESDSVLSSTTDINLANVLFNNAATTTIDSLTANETYSLAIWSYDDFGNKASSSRVDIFTNDAPNGNFNSVVQKTDGSQIVDISIEADDLNNNDTLKAKITYATGTTCSFTSASDPTLDENSSTVLADYGLPTISNSEEYQIGTTSSWILTSPGSNTVDFDWLAYDDLPQGDSIYCLSLMLNDSYDDQLVYATTTLIIDNVSPIASASLTKGAVTENSIVLLYATTSPATDTNEPNSNAYKIFYKEGVSGVTETDTEIDSIDLDAYDYNLATSTVLTGLNQNTWYVFNIWSYDSFGNVASSTEIAIKTNASIANDSLEFVNYLSYQGAHNIAVAGNNEWLFRAKVSETNGYLALASTTLYLANQNDVSPYYSDFAVSWDQSSNNFTEIGNDIDSLLTLSASSSSSCAGNTCELNFVVVFAKSLASSSINFSAELVTGNDSSVVDEDIYTNFYQVRIPYIEQLHYRWRNDDGGE